LLVALLVAAPVAAAVSADKPSSYVTLVSIGDASQCQGAPQFSRRLYADGTFADFATPANQVLVITAVEIQGQGFSPGRRQPVNILQTPSLSPRIVVYADVDPFGFIGSYQPISPVVVESGQALCLEVFNGLTIAKLHGFLTRDR
jgi:hypothetical protein